MSSLNADKVVCESTKAEKNEAQIASECKEILMMRTMRSVPPKPPFHAEEKEEKDTADAASKKAFYGVFVSSSLEEEEVRNNISRRDFEISQPLLYSLNVSLFVSLFRAKNEKTRTREHFSSLLCFSRSPYSLSLTLTGEV